MKKIIAFPFIFIIFACVSKTNGIYDAVFFEKLTLYAKNKPFIIDIRQKEDYKAWHIKGAFNMGMEDVLDPTVQDTLKPESYVIVYGYTSKDSSDFVKELKLIGFERVLDGGDFNNFKTLKKYLKSK